MNTKLSLAALLGASLIFSSCLSANEGLPHAFEAGWKGEKTCELMFEDASVRVGRCIFPPGVGHEKHYHSPHFGYVLEGGTLKITDKHENGWHLENRLHHGARSGKYWRYNNQLHHCGTKAGQGDAVNLILST